MGNDGEVLNSLSALPPDWFNTAYFSCHCCLEEFGFYWISIDNFDAKNCPQCYLAWKLNYGTYCLQQ